MLEFLLADQNLPFSIALMIMLFMAAIESLCAFLAFGSSTLIDLFDADIDMELEIDSPLPKGGITPLQWVMTLIRVRGVPLAILLMLFLFCFACVGLLLQNGTETWLGEFLPLTTALPIALIIAFPLSKWLARGIAHLIPKDTTSAVSLVSLIGHHAEIVLGQAQKGCPASAKAKDRFGKTHYFMLEPIDAQTTFSCGEKVLLFSYAKGRFFASRFPAEQISSNPSSPI